MTGTGNWECFNVSRSITPNRRVSRRTYVSDFASLQTPCGHRASLFSLAQKVPCLTSLLTQLPRYLTTYLPYTERAQFQFQ